MFASRTGAHRSSRALDKGYFSLVRFTAQLVRSTRRAQPPLRRVFESLRAAQPFARRLFIAALIVVYAVIAGVSAIGLVVFAATSSLMYIDLRMRTEGLDLELSRYVEARQAGTPVPDPYLPRA